MADGKLMILYYQSRTECTRYMQQNQCLPHPRRLWRAMSQSTERQRTGDADEADGRRIDTAELVRFNRDRRSGAKPHSHTRPGTGETGGARGEASAVGLSCAGTPPHRECDHAQAGRQCTCSVAKAGYLAACSTTTHAARRGALPVGGIG